MERERERDGYFNTPQIELHGCIADNCVPCIHVMCTITQQITNTLQVLLATDGIQSVSIFIYHDIQWGASAQIGFNLGDGFVSFTFPEALTPQTIDIDQLSNVGRRGIFAFRIDSECVPVSYCPPT